LQGGDAEGRRDVEEGERVVDFGPEEEGEVLGGGKRRGAGGRVRLREGGVGGAERGGGDG
jgi:hypothetical protein